MSFGLLMEAALQRFHWPIDVHGTAKPERETERKPALEKYKYNQVQIKNQVPQNAILPLKSQTFPRPQSHNASLSITSPPQSLENMCLYIQLPVCLSFGLLSVYTCICVSRLTHLSVYIYMDLSVCHLYHQYIGKLAVFLKQIHRPGCSNVVSVCKTDSQTWLLKCGQCV